MKVAIIGASNKEDRYSCKAVKLLKEKGHEVYPVHQRIKDIEGIPVYSSIGSIEDDIDTVTMYVASDVSDKIGDEIVSKEPRRIIFNPGAENPTLEQKAKDKGIATQNACTLVMLNTGQF